MNNGGRVEQTGSPREIYEHPRTAFVADFIGSLRSTYPFSSLNHFTVPVSRAR